MKLRHNVLLTRHPIVFIHGLKGFLNFYNYWHGIPQYLKQHGYEVKILNTFWRGPQNKRVSDLENKILNLESKIHIISHSMGTLDSLLLIERECLKNKVASLTLVSPPFSGTPWADRLAPLTPGLHQELTSKGAKKILSLFKNRYQVPITTIISNPQYPLSPLLLLQHKILAHELTRQGLSPENDGLVPLESQKCALDISHKNIFFPGDHHQVVGAGPWPKTCKSANEVYLDHCIFLAESDLRNAE